ncbi:MAG: beta-ketoacyl-[acyl-carrier-protein] synthase family protein [Sedimentisphaerales bacterium]|nr:beta-ketoacyl-[acyl-carrier-protein] synthase family protein [Sedimentisphaerales bacterium]
MGRAETIIDHRVVITGIGAISCLGCDLDTIADSLYHGRSGIVCDTERKALGFRSGLTGAIKGFEPNKYACRKTRKTMTLYTIQSYAAVLQALALSGLAPESLQNEMTGLLFGSDSSALDCYEQASLTANRKDTGILGSGYIFKAMTSNITMNLNVLLKTKGACWTISSACSSSGHAIGQGADLIRSGRQEIVICGGAQEINWQSVCGFDSLNAFSVREDKPELASRPFSHDRDGLVPSGGAAAVILESFDSAYRRGAVILGEISGYGFSSDGGNISVPDSDGLFRSMTMALKNAGMSPEQIDYICAHATSTPLGDAEEAKAINRVFTTDSPRVSSLKGMCGHELWMAGAGQVVYTTIMAMKGFTAPNINFTGPDKHSEKLNILTETDNYPPVGVICNSAGFGGTNSSLVINYAI